MDLSLVPRTSANGSDLTENSTDTRFVQLTAHTPRQPPAFSPNALTAGFRFDHYQLLPPVGTPRQTINSIVSRDLLNTGRLCSNESEANTIRHIPSPSRFEEVFTSPQGIRPLIETCQVSPEQSKDKTPDITADTEIKEEEGSVAMSAAAIKKHRISISRIVEAWRDEFSQYIFADMGDPLFIKQVIMDALTSKKNLEDAMTHLREIDPEADELEEEFTDLKCKYLKFIRGGQAFLATPNSTPNNTPHSTPNSSPTRTSRDKHKKKRVENYEGQTLRNLDQVASEINSLFITLPEGDRLIKDTEDRFANYNKKADMIIKDGTSLCSDAADVGYDDQAGALEDGVRKVQNALIEGQSQLGELKSRAGMFGSSNTFKSSDIKPPTFSGDGEAAGEYFSFHREYFEFADSRAYTKTQHLHTLKKTCLTGTARLACSEMETVEEIFNYLKRTYGNPNLLLIQKIKEFKKLGTCPNPADKRRDWLIKVQQQLKYLIKISTDHKMLADLHYSDVLNVIHTSMHYKAQTLFREGIEHMDWANMSRQEVFEETVNFLDQQVSKASADIKLNFLLGIDQPEKSKPAAKPAPKKVYTATNAGAVDSGSDDEPEPSQDPNAAAVPTPTAAVAKPTKPYVPPKAVKCKLCGDSHEYLFYCEKYQNVRVNERFNLTRTTKCCVRCLRLDSEFDSTDRWNWWLNHEHNCLTEWACKTNDCKGKQLSFQYHFTMCRRHIRENKARSADFLAALDKKLLKPNAHFFFNQPLSYATQPGGLPPPPPELDPGIHAKPPPNVPAIFLMQFVVTPAGQDLLVFYDSGCSNACMSDNAVRVLKSNTVRQGPTVMGVAGGGSVTFPGGEEMFLLDTTDPAEKATFVAINMPEVTTPFPVWELQAAYNSVVEFRDSQPGSTQVLPQVPDQVGGRPVDILIGIQYNTYFPKVIFTLPCGLAIYESRLKAPGGFQGVLGGPHQSWAQATSSAQVLNPRTFFSSELRAYRSQSNALKSLFKDFQHFERNEEFNYNHGYESDKEESDEEERKLEERRTEEVELSFPCADGLNSDTNKCDIMEDETRDPTPLIIPRGSDKFQVLRPQSVLQGLQGFMPNECVSNHCDNHRMEDGWTAPAHWNVDSYLLNHKTDLDRFENLEEVGSSLTYRCLRCRNCHDCRNGAHLEKVSLEEELDQAHLASCVWYNPETGFMEARLPFKQDPISALPDNRFQAERMLQSQLKGIAKRPGCKEDIFRAHNKLRDKGYVVAIEDLPDDIKNIVVSSEGKYYIPWSVVYKVGSISSPSRIVFNASMKTKSGHSLNSILAKGMNKLPRILHLLNQFGLHRTGFSCDISMAYNSVRLLPEFITFQRYLWAEGLDLNDPVVEMCVITLIYGVTPSGGLMTEGFASTADYAVEHHPAHAEGAQVLKESSYVDDILKSCKTLEQAHRLADSITYVLKLAGTVTKGFTFSGSDPVETVSADGKSVGVLGYVWWPKLDLISLAEKDLCLGKSSRGRAAAPVVGDLKTALALVFTRRVLAGKVCGIFDPKGLVTPISARIKLCLSEIVDLKLGWDDKIPPKYLDIWVKNLMDIQKLCTLRFPRCYVHPDAVNEKIELIVQVDASMNVAVAVVHARVELPDGTFACRLVSAKSKLVHLSTIPRGELRAAVMGATLAHIVKQNIGSSFSKIYYVTDSTIVLSWLNRDQRPLHTLVRNAVIEVRRLSEVSDWFHIESAYNLADLGTRNCEIEELNSTSAWQIGHAWMKLPRDQLPLKSMADIMLSQSEKREAAKEVKEQDVAGYTLTELKDKLSERYKFSRYLVDPCARPWPKSVRILGLVLKFIKLCSIPREKRNFSENLSPSENFASSDKPPAPLILKSVSDGTPPLPLEVGDSKNDDVSTFLSKLRPGAVIFTPSLNSDSCVYNDVIEKSADCQNKPSVTQFSSLDAISADSSASPQLETGFQQVASPSLGTEAGREVELSASTQQGTGITTSAYAAGQARRPGGIQLTTAETHEAEKYFFRKSTEEVKRFSSEREYLHASKEVDGILYYQGRILDGQSVDDVENVMTDIDPLNFVKPITDRYSPVSYAVMLHVHSRVTHHRNATTTLLESRSIVYIIRGRDLSNEVRNSCNYCRRYKAKLLEVEMGNLHKSRLRVASAFFTVQVDLFGPYIARCEHQPHRANVSVWGVLFKCPASGALSACAMSRYDTEAFIMAYSRHAYRYGHPVHLFVDQGSQIMKACREMEWSWADITHTLNAKFHVGVEYTAAPVLGHNQIGMVERAVREVKKVFNMVFTGLRLDSLSYETSFQYIANELNNLPIALGSRYENMDHLDLITPSRLILGRNNRRAPAGYARVDPQLGYSKNKSKQIKDMDNVHRAWWKVWQEEKLSDYIPRPNKWLKTTRVPLVGDVVVFLEKDKEATLGKTLWKLGEILGTKLSTDTGVRMLNIGYRNASETTLRETWRPTRKVAILFREGDLDMVEELNKAAKDATVSLYARINGLWRCPSTFCTSSCVDAERHGPHVDVGGPKE